MLRDLLRIALGPPNGMQVAGIPVILGGEHTMIFANLACLLSDGDGLRQALQWGGASCNKPCFRHWNVVRPGCPLSHVEGYVSTHCADHSCFKLLSEEDLASVVDVAVEAWQQGQRGEMSAAQVEDTHRALGFKATAGGLLADPQLRSLVKWTQVVRYDWAHTFLADSIVGKALWSLIEAAEQNGIFTQRDIFEFLNESWMFPTQTSSDQPTSSSNRSQLSAIFSHTKAQVNERHGTIKCSMSQLLSLYRILDHFISMRVVSGGPLEKQVLAFKQVSSAVDLLLAVKHRRSKARSTGQLLTGILEQHMKLLHELGAARITPKYHWAFDVAECLMMDDFLVDAFRLERLHLRVKRVAENCKNLTHYEVAVMRGVTLRHRNLINDVQDWSQTCYLFGKVANPPWAPSVRMADKACFHQEEFRNGFFVCRGFVCWVGSCMAR